MNILNSKSWKSLTSSVYGLWIIGFLSVSLLALFNSARLRLELSLMGRPQGWDLAFRRAFEEWYSIGIFIPMVLWLASKFRLGLAPLNQWIKAHTSGAILFSIGYMLVYSWVLHSQISVEGVRFEFPVVMRKLALHYLPSQLCIYFALVLIHNGIAYHQRATKTQLRAAELESELIGAKLETLRMQLNPHFLFNTLHAISSLIHDNPSAADRTIARLSELLRLTLTPSPNHETKLHDELRFLSSYLEIEQIRFGDRLSVTFDIDPTIMEALVPSLLLQPIVENSIRHGIESLPTPGRIVIQAYGQARRLHIVVTDNGLGLTNSGREATSNGVGLSNVKSRLLHLYGSDQSFELTSLEPQGAECRITIPLKEKPR